MTESLLVSWSAPEEQGSPITGYVVEDEGRGSQTAAADHPIVGFDNLPGGIVHCFRVYALSGAGRSPPAPQASCGKAYSRVVAAPIHVRAAPIPRGARITWDPPLPNDGPPIGSYGIRSVPYDRSAGAAADQRSADVIGLKEGATYTFTIVAYSALCCVGGMSEPVETNPVTVATVWPEGGAWHQAPLLPDSSTQSAFVLGGRLYAVGNTDIYSTALDESGRPTTWTKAGAAGVGFGGSSARSVYSADGKTGFLYLTGGGETMAGNLGEVWVAPIPGDGSVGAFTRTASISPAPRNHASAVDGRHLYVVGGSWWSGGSYTGIGTDLPLVQVADIGDDGSLSSWRRAGMLPRAAGWAAAVTHQHRLYALSPHGGGIDVLYADLNADGSAAGFKRASAQPDPTLGRFAAAVSGGRLYLLGGTSFWQNGSTPSAAVLIGRIGPDGDILSWETSSSEDFNGPRSGPAVAFSDGGAPAGAGGARAYLMGGYDGPFYDAQWAAVDPATGHLAPWSPPANPRPPDAPLRIRATAGNASATVRWEPPASDGGLPISGYLVTSTPAGAKAEVDGAATSATLTDLKNGLSYTFQVAARNAAGSGAGSGPSEDAVPTPSPRWRPAPQVQVSTYPAQNLFASGNELFFMTAARRGVVPLDSDGLPWGQLGPGYQGGGSLTWNSWAPAVRPIDAQTACVYRVGGFQSETGTMVDCIRADGFFGQDLRAPSVQEKLQTGRGRGAAAFAGKFLYVLGGSQRVGQSTVDLDDVSFAPLLQDGSLGAWAHTTPLPSPASQPLVVARSNSLYLVGAGAVQRAVAAADGTLGAWRADGPPLPISAQNLKAAISGNFLYVAGGGALAVGSLDETGAITGWRADPADALPYKDPYGLVAAGDKLYLWGDYTLAVARIDAGHLLPW